MPGVLLSLSKQMNLNDTESVITIIDNFNFPNVQAQSEALQELRADLGVRHTEMMKLLQISRANWMKLANGDVSLKPLQLRFLLLQLMIRNHNPDLFWRLISGEQLGAGRSAPRF